MQQPTVYDHRNVYDDGAGGGGGGGIPEGYTQCAYFEFLQNNCSVYHDNSGFFNDVSKTDTIKIVGSLKGGDTGYNNGIRTGFKLSNNQNTYFKIIYNKTADVTRLQSFWNYVDKAHNLGMMCFGRFGNNDSIFIDNATASNDNRSNDIVAIKTLFEVEGDYIGSRFSLFEIIGSDGTIKHKLIPAININNSNNVVLDIVTATEFVLDTSKIKCGPTIF